MYCAYIPFNYINADNSSRWSLCYIPNLHHNRYFPFTLSCSCWLVKQECLMLSITDPMGFTYKVYLHWSVLMVMACQISCTTDTNSTILIPLTYNGFHQFLLWCLSFYWVKWQCILCYFFLANMMESVMEAPTQLWIELVSVNPFTVFLWMSKKVSAHYSSSSCPLCIELP